MKYEKSAYSKRLDLRRQLARLIRCQKQDSERAALKTHNAERAATEITSMRCLDSAQTWTTIVRNRGRQIALVEARLAALGAES